MPKTTPREEAAVKKLDQNGAPRYVACDLTVTQKKELDAFIDGATLEELHQWMIGRIMANHSISVRVLDVGFQCSLTGSKGNSNHENICLISRSSTPHRAMWSVMFKDVKILQGTWPVSNRLEDLD